jgi:hypothetical protein
LLASGEDARLPESLECRVCRERPRAGQTPHSAQLYLAMTESAYYHCGICQSWFETHSRFSNSIFLVENEGAIRALNYFCISEMEMTYGAYYRFENSLKSVFYRIQDLYFSLVRKLT